MIYLLCGIIPVVLFLKGEGGDAGLVGVAAHRAVRDAQGDPYGPLLIFTLADHLQDPGFVFVGNRKGFPGRSITILGHQVSDHLYGLPGGLGALEGDPHQRSVIKESSRLRLQRIESPEGGLPDGHLVLIHKLNHRIGMGYLGDGPQEFAVLVMVDFTGGSRGMIGGGVKGDGAVTGVGVGGIGDHH